MPNEIRDSPSGPLLTLDTDSILNDSNVPGTTLTDALDNLTDAIPATGTEPGFIARRVFVNATSTKLNTTFMGVVVQAAVAITSMAQVQPGNLFHIGLASAGASGSSGGRVSGSLSGPWSTTGAGGGGFYEFWLSRDDIARILATAGSITMSTPLGGAISIGPSGTTGNATNVAGNNPTGPTIFGPYRIFPGGGGNTAAIASQRAGGAGGGLTSAGAGGITSTAATAGGGPLGGGTESIYGGGGCPTSAGVNGTNGGSSIFGGAAGSASGNTSDDPRAGGTSLRGAGGGGSGSGSNGAGAGSTAGAGGSTGNGFCVGGTGQGASSGGAGARAGQNGAPGADTTDVWVSCGAGGQGGGSAMSTDSSAIGGNGGAGGFPGGGGGGGGTGNARIDGQTSKGGDSGAGGDALIIIDSYL